MGIWSFYFIGKLYLFFRGFIRFNFILNILLAIFIVLPIPKNILFYRSLRAAKYLVGAVAAFLLLWYDSWLPPLLHSIRLLRETGGITEGFILRFLTNSVNPKEAAILAALFIICVSIRKRIRLAPVVFTAMLIVPLYEWGQPKEEMRDYLDTFYRAESKRIIRFEESNANAPDFDIVILHICSLSWDDLKALGLADHPFFKHFDFLFTNFNSVASYTNPAAIRLLRANCGQMPPQALYQDAPKECSLLQSLREHRYETYSAIDNDAPSYHFVYDMMTYGLADSPIEMSDLLIRQYDFDGTPIYDDRALLEKWWDMRQNSSSGRAALYIDLTTLHGGAHWAHDEDWWKRDRASQYREFLQNLFENLDHFLKRIDSSGRNCVVIFVPEHGAALRGSSIQAPDLRDIPLPQITLVPVGIKLIGTGHPLIPERQEIISKPTSFLALSYMLASFLKEPPFGSDRLSYQNILSHIPETNFVSDNQSARVVKAGEYYYLNDKENQWTKLSPSGDIK